MPQTDGVADHAAPKTNPVTLTLGQFLEWLSHFLLNARKAWIGFLVAGGASAIAQNIATLNFSSVGLHNLWQGLVGGVLTGFVVYWVRNEMGHFDPSVTQASPQEPSG